MASDNASWVLDSGEFMSMLTRSQTTPFYPQRGIAFSYIFDYSHSHEEIRKVRQQAYEYVESIDQIES
jgi:hypothetical protein